MIQRKAVLAGLILLIASGIRAGSVKVNVRTPGTLPNLIDSKQKNEITQLTLSGKLNGTDLRFLREMAGRDDREQPTPGRLRKVDLSDAIFATGGEPYLRRGNHEVYRPTSAYTVPKFLFRFSRIEQVILPHRTDSIDTAAFEYSGLRSIRLTEGITVGDWAFNRDSLLERITFPAYIKEIGPDCFHQCRALTTLTLHDIFYIPWHCFSDLPGLQTFTLDGDLLHADADLFYNCPRLQQITFAGNVASTGGPSIADNCPRLQSITFSGCVFICGFTSVQRCPLLKSCRVKGAVINGSNNDFIQTTKGKAAPKTLQTLDRTIEKFLGKDSTYGIWSFLSNNVLYNMACLHSLAGDKAKALQSLGLSVRHGYNDYAKIQKDSDLISLHGDPHFDALIQEARLTGDKILILRKSRPYDRSTRPDKSFTYQAATDPDLVRLKETFRLDSIAGQGDEISRIKRLMYWVHDLIRHDGSGGFPDNCPRDAIDLIRACKAQKRGLNCRGLAIVLSEIYLAMGWPARFVTCQSREYNTDPDCHVIDMVWSRSLGKWIWMDPTFAAFVTDEKGLLLHPGEVRQHLIEGSPLVLNEDANWNHESKKTKENYLETYMAKNLYLLGTCLWNGYKAEDDNRPNTMVTLTPGGMSVRYGISTQNDEYFWQKPEGE